MKKTVGSVFPRVITTLNTGGSQRMSEDPMKALIRQEAAEYTKRVYPYIDKRVRKYTAKNGVTTLVMRG